MVSKSSLEPDGEHEYIVVEFGPVVGETSVSRAGPMFQKTLGQTQQHGPLSPKTIYACACAI